MIDENGQAETPAEGNPSGFLTAMARLKKIEKRFSLDGQASMGEYWATFLVRWLPLALVSGGLMYAAGHIDMSATNDNSKVISSLFQTLWVAIQIFIPALFTIANLEMFPVTVRRLRDAKVCVGLAAIMMPAVVFCTAVAAFYPWLVCVSALILLVPGILPSRAGADGAQAAGITEKTKMCYLAAVLFIMAATALGIATEALILRFGLAKMAAKYRTSQSEEMSEKAASKEIKLSKATLKEMQFRGRELITGIIQANIDRDRMGKASLWPRTYKKERADSDDVAGKAYKSAADYFNALFDMAHYGTSKWNPAVDGELLRTLGRNAVVDGKINPAGLEWCIAANVEEWTSDNVPVLISANVNPASVRDDQALVVVRKSGASDFIETPSYGAVYKEKPDDEGEHPIVWLTPTGVVNPPRQ